MNTEHKTHPCVVHGNGPSKLVFNNYANYLAGAFVNGICTACKENNLQLVADDEAALPSVTLALFVEKATPFLKEFFETIVALDYPHKRIDLFVHNAVKNPLLPLIVYSIDKCLLNYYRLCITRKLWMRF